MKNNYIHYFDIIGGSIDFNYRNGSFKTNLGGILSLIMLVILCLLIFAFGRDFYKRINPEFIQQTLVPEKELMLSVNNKNFTIAVRLEDNGSYTINKTNSYYIEAEYRSFHLDDKNEWYEIVEILEMSDCSEELFNSKESFEFDSYHEWTCPIFNNITFGSNETFGSSIKLNYYICNEGFINPYTKENCAVKEETDLLRSNLLYMSIAYQTAVVNPSNYYNGLTNKVIYSWVSLDPKFYKLSFVFFTQYIMTTDYGWIFEDHKTDSLMVMNKLNTDIIDIHSMPNNNMLGSYWLYINQGSGIELFIRKFVKIQSLAAEVGGIMNFFYTLLSIFLLNYNNHELLNKLIPYYYPNLNEDNKNLFSSFKDFDEFDENRKKIIHKHNIKVNSNQIMELEVSKLKLFHNRYYSPQKDRKYIENLNFKQNECSINKNLMLQENTIKYNYSLHHNFKFDKEYNYKKSHSQEIKNNQNPFKMEINNNSNQNILLIQFMERNKNNLKLMDVVDKLYIRKSNSKTYSNEIEKESLNFISFLSYMYICRCSKAKLKKACFLKQLHSLIENEFDIINFLKNKAEIVNLKKIMNNNSIVPHEIQFQNEVVLYDFLLHCIK